jgi:hypothetical protein
MANDNIEDIAELKPYQAQLRAIGYKSVQQFVGAAVAVPEILSRYLNADVNDLMQYVPRAGRLQARVELSREFALGVALDLVPRPRLAFQISRPISDIPKVNLIREMNAVRDQANRGTCVAHAALAIVEHYAGTQGKTSDFSEQFLYWNCKATDGHPTLSGTWLGVAMPLLQRDGCCLENTWRYEPEPKLGNEGQGPAPEGAQVEALNHRISRFNQLPPTSVNDIKHELQRGRCVAFSVPVFNSWLRNVEVTRTGEIVLPIPEEERTGGHAMCIVGYEDLPSEGEWGGGKFLVRNSWDSYWATESEYGQGYGTIPYAYIARFGTEAYSVE